ncbi:hypothetical protein FBF74_01910 [Micrococcus luteus]|nr:hypothetical protein FBF74_01910 [Micrococcus luteus]
MPPSWKSSSGSGTGPSSAHVVSDGTGAVARAGEDGATEGLDAPVALEETLLWEAEHPEMAVLTRAAATTAADHAARFVVMSIRMI